MTVYIAVHTEIFDFGRYTLEFKQTPHSNQSYPDQLLIRPQSFPRHVFLLLAYMLHSVSHRTNVIEGMNGLSRFHGNLPDWIMHLACEVDFFGSARLQIEKGFILRVGWMCSVHSCTLGFDMSFVFLCLFLFCLFVCLFFVHNVVQRSKHWISHV